MRRLVSLIVTLLLLAGHVAAADDDADKKKEKAKDKPPADSGIVEDVVVSASARAEALLDAPAAVTVISGEELEVNPGDLLVDHLRRVPGINVVQFSARDVNIASRSSTDS